MEDIGQTVVRTPKRTTKQDRSWVVTLNNYREKEVIQSWEWMEQYCAYAIFGFEYSDDGTPHIQGYFRVKRTNKLRYNSLRGSNSLYLRCLSLGRAKRGAPN